MECAGGQVITYDLGVRQCERLAVPLPFSGMGVHHCAMVTLSENGHERMDPGACLVGDWVKALNLPKWKIGMQEFIPDGQVESAEPWYFGPVFNGPNLFGWQRLE